MGGEVRDFFVDGGIDVFKAFFLFGSSLPARAMSSTTACPPSSAESTTSSETDRYGKGHEGIIFTT